ncbi:patched domain-containing protein 3-like [Centropristis striata]|uniref:patched domain-containing protein 3-like n=1 Tax=Centropristis striata TaxID=184440 RepID=UPI0027DF7F23|nr:patched domain-containing protein 3-like [Centropristis striata]XP_059183041.1 patched domain-containing protein 3-like [Centropristis striata]
MGCRRTDCLAKPLSGLFERLGSLVGSFPFYFFVIPLVLTAALGGGFSFLKDREDNDFERQFTPKKGPSKVTRAFIRENFPYNDSMFSEDRLYDDGNFASLIALSTNRSNILKNPAFEDIIRLNNKILNIAVLNNSVGFSELCAKANGQCVSNVVLELISSNESSIIFPVHTHRSSSVFLGSVLGGVITDANSSVIRAQAIKLFYYLDNEESKADASKLWLRGFKKLLSDEPKSKHIEVSYYTSKSKQEEIDSHTTDGFPLFLITYACAITFSVISCLRLDNVRNKVWVAVFGVLSSGLAVVSSFGLLLYIGVPFVITVANSPFLILGIGLNNMFIMVSDWQHTNVKDPVPKRMAHSYKEAIMSITITALTDILKFSIGVKSDFASVQSFCLYTVASIVFSYIYTITFFGAFLALNGRREASNRHWLTCRKIPSDNKDHHITISNICCVGGGYDENTGAEKKQPASNFFKDYYGPFLIKPCVKGVVIFLYVVYLAVSIYGCLHVQQGTELYDLAADDSHVTRFKVKDRQYFSDYSPSVMLIVSEEFPYWDKTSRHQLRGCVEDFKKLQFVDEDVFTSWLESYLSYGQHQRLNLDDKDVFLKNLPHFFDLFPFFKQDVNLTGDAIHASRFFIQTVNISNANMEIEMLSGLKATVERCNAASLLAYNHKFIFYDQYDFVVSSTIKNVGVITAAMLVVSLLLIPDPLCSLWVTCSIGSVTAGVTGFMAIWNISLDSISMIIFTVCIGFTVDFSAHMSYVFVSSEKKSPDDKAVDALSSLGYPILQGAVSTILGVSVLSTSEFHTFRTFFKIFFLVMFNGMIHGLVFMPVILSLFSCKSEKNESKDETLKISKL